MVATGKVDFSISQQEQVTTARLNNLPIVSLAAIIQHNTSGFASLKGKNINTAKDFEGKVYGGRGFQSETAVLASLMQKEKADFKKIRIINIGGADPLASLSKDIDLTWIYYGWTGIQAEIRKQELNMIWLKDIDPALDYYTQVFITSEKMIREKPDTVRKVMNAVSKGYAFSVQNPAQAAEILIKHAPKSDPEIIRKSQLWLSLQYQADAPRWGEQKESVWKGYARWMYDNKLITKMIDPDKAYTNEFLPGK
ncbi:MAG: ABC transporter substrate-binding protein [Peptococcaceae bacterium]|nr:ABC transporter substrate-binding protein [Peptococcaceae bacterium]